MKISCAGALLGLAMAAVGFAGTEATTQPASCCDGECMTMPAKSNSILTLADMGAPATATAPAAVDVENTKCVIETDQEASKNVTYTYKDKIYHFCCADCIDDFKKDPEHYIAAMKADPDKWGIKK